MAVNAISSSTGATPQAVQPRKPEEAQTQKTVDPKAVDEAAKARRAQQQQAQKPDLPKPVVNAEGQKTGQVISVTA